MSAVAELPSTEKSAYELERGKPAPSYNHGILQARLVVLLARAGSRYEVASEVALSISGKAYTPDICLFPARPTDWDHDQIKVLTAPILAVEILSPTQGFNSMVEKLEAYFSHGVKRCWIVQPGLNIITVFRSMRDRSTYDSGVVKDEELGIELDLGALFA